MLRTILLHTTILVVLSANYFKAVVRADETNKVADSPTTINITTSATGDCRLTIGHRPALGASATRATVVERLPNGVTSFRHAFLAEDSLDGYLQVENISVDATSKAVVFAPKESKDSQGPRAGFMYPKRLRLPASVEVAVSNLGEADSLFVSLQAQQPSRTRIVIRLKSENRLRETAKLTVAFQPNGQSSKQDVLIDDKTVSLSNEETVPFRLPVPSDPMNDPFELFLTVRGPTTSTITSMAVSGRISPTFGMNLDAQGEKVFAKTVVPTGLAGKAGVESGDVLVSINGKPAKTVKESVALLGKVEFGDKCNLVIRRGGKQKAIRIAVE